MNAPDPGSWSHPAGTSTIDTQTSADTAEAGTQAARTTATIGTQVVRTETRSACNQTTAEPVKSCSAASQTPPQTAPVVWLLAGLATAAVIVSALVWTQRDTQRRGGPSGSA